MNLNIGIGENHTQMIFDFLNQFKKEYNISFYINFDHVYSYNTDFKDKFLKLNTYNIPYLYLLSYNNSEFHPEEMPYMPMGYVVNTFDKAVDLKEKYPNTRIDISVNTIDYEVDKFMKNLDTWDFINIKNWENYDLDVINKITDLGKQVKIIVDQGCFNKRDKFFIERGHKYIPCLKIFSKNDPGIHSCKCECKTLFQDWMYLTCNWVNYRLAKYLPKNVDYKFATRTANDMNTIYTLQAFFSDEIFNNIKVNVTDEFIKQRMRCKHNCIECQFCRKYFEENKI